MRVTSKATLALSMLMVLGFLLVCAGFFSARMLRMPGAPPQRRRCRRPPRLRSIPRCRRLQLVPPKRSSSSRRRSMGGNRVAAGHSRPGLRLSLADAITYLDTAPNPYSPTRTYGNPVSNTSACT